MRVLTITRDNFYRVLWDDEIAEFDYQSRTARPNWNLGRQTPAVFRFYPVIKDDAGDFRINISEIEWFTRELLTPRQWDYWVDPITAQFNETGWPMMAYITMSGNLLRGKRIVRDNRGVEMLEFETLTPSTVKSGMRYENTQGLIHRFGIVGVDRYGVTYHTNQTPQGIIDYACVSKEGVCYIPTKYVKVV